MQLQLFLISFLLQLVPVILHPDNDIHTSNSSKILSRKKRYLTFPEGSSFQLVYCLTMPTYGMGQIFTIGLTAALAWELPHDPIDFKKTKTDSADKRIDIQTHKSPIKHKYITNEVTQYQTGDLFDFPAYRNEYLYRKHGHAHRRTRRDLFAKIERFFEAQNKDGKSCLLKAICEVNQSKDREKGTFVEEILRAIFTWIPADENDIEHAKIDDAALHNGNCTEKYPTCTQSVWNSFF